jgi:hypothetical protein
MQIDPINLRRIDTGTSNSIQLRQMRSAPAGDNGKDPSK